MKYKVLVTPLVPCQTCFPSFSALLSSLEADLHLQNRLPVYRLLLGLYSGSKAGEISIWRIEWGGSLIPLHPSPLPVPPPHCLAGSGYLAVPSFKAPHSLYLGALVRESLPIPYRCPASLSITSPFTKPFSVNSLNTPPVSSKDHLCSLHRIIRSL